MNGIEAITATNGWAMAATGATIVMIGLSLLSLIISKLHKIISIFEKKPIETPPDTPVTSFDPTAADALLLSDPSGAARIYQGLTVELGDTFELGVFYRKLKEAGGVYPHITTRSLRESGQLIFKGDGMFSWKTN